MGCCEESVGPTRHTRAQHLHMVGDMPSSKIIGLISDHTTLSLGLGVTVVALAIAAGALGAGAVVVVGEEVAVVSDEEFGGVEVACPPLVERFASTMTVRVVVVVRPDWSVATYWMVSVASSVRVTCA